MITDFWKNDLNKPESSFFIRSKMFNQIESGIALRVNIKDSISH